MEDWALLTYSEDRSERKQEEVNTIRGNPLARMYICLCLQMKRVWHCLGFEFK